MNVSLHLRYRSTSNKRTKTTLSWSPPLIVCNSFKFSPLYFQSWEITFPLKQSNKSFDKQRNLRLETCSLPYIIKKSSTRPWFCTFIILLEILCLDYTTILIFGLERVKWFWRKMFSIIYMLQTFCKAHPFLWESVVCCIAMEATEIEDYCREVSHSQVSLALHFYWTGRENRKLLRTQLTPFWIVSLPLWRAWKSIEGLSLTDVALN